MNIVIRPFRDEDAHPLSIIESESFSMPWSEKDFRDLLNMDYVTCLVAEVDGEIAGSCEMSDRMHEGNIDNVVVALKYRGKGICQKLMQAIIDEGIKTGIEAFTLEVRVSNAAAIHVYEKLGFVSEGIRPRFYEKPVEDAMIMWKRL